MTKPAPPERKVEEASTARAAAALTAFKSAKVSRSSSSVADTSLLVPPVSARAAVGLDCRFCSVSFVGSKLSTCTVSEKERYLVHASN